MVGELASDKPIHKIGELVTNVASPYPYNTIFKITKERQEKGWYFYTLEPLNMLQKLKTKLTNPKIIRAFPESVCKEETEKSK